MKTVKLPSGSRVPAFGLGTWRMGDEPAKRKEEIATLRLGIELGATLVDTAEMYGDGRAEQLIAEAIEGKRDEAFLVSKVLPSNASRRGVAAACDRSLRRLKTDRIDLYLLHWRGNVPFSETIQAFQELQQAGKILHYGVSNLDRSELEEWWGIEGGPAIATDQLLYNLARRSIEVDLLPWLRRRHIPVMAYSPVEQGRLLNNQNLADFARRNRMTGAQAALAWLLSKDDVIVIPKTSRREALKENIEALKHPLSESQLAELDNLFPAPKHATRLEML